MNTPKIIRYLFVFLMALIILYKVELAAYWVTIGFAIRILTFPESDEYSLTTLDSTLMVVIWPYSAYIYISHFLLPAILEHFKK